MGDSLTKPTGRAIVVNQYSNTYFKRFTRGRRHLFGHIFSGRNGMSYYGVMTVSRVHRLLRTAGFSIRNSWTQGEISFVEASPTSQVQPHIAGKGSKAPM